MPCPGCTHFSKMVFGSIVASDPRKAGQAPWVSLTYFHHSRGYLTRVSPACENEQSRSFLPLPFRGILKIVCYVIGRGTPIGILFPLLSEQEVVDEAYTPNIPIDFLLLDYRWVETKTISFMSLHSTFLLHAFLYSHFTMDIQNTRGICLTPPTHLAACRDESLLGHKDKRSVKDAKVENIRFSPLFSFAVVQPIDYKNKETCMKRHDKTPLNY